MLVGNFRRNCTLAIKATSFTVLILVQGAVYAEPVNIESGLVQGTVEDRLSVYRGIPYAASPLGDLRWRATQPAPKWQGVRAANEFGRACIQSNPAIATEVFLC
jgi:para-nitrobenzyl esterase